MQTIIEILLQAGRSAVDVALYILLPIMVAMMILMRALEASGAVDWMVRRLTPVVRPFGLTGLGLMGMIQISLVSFVAPIPTLVLMEKRGTSDLHLATGFAAILAMAPANAVFPLATLGLRPGPVLGLSILAGFAAATSTFWLFGRGLPQVSRPAMPEEDATLRPASILGVINRGGAEAIRIVINIIPMLLLSLAAVFALQRAGVVDAAVTTLSPFLHLWGIDPALVLPTVTKYLAGGTALVGVTSEMVAAGKIGSEAINRSAGFLLNPVDLAGLSIYISAVSRLGPILWPALGGACLGIALRTIGTALIG